MSARDRRSGVAVDVLGNDTVTFVHREVVGVDRYGNDVTMDTETTITGCSMQPMWGQESVGNWDQTVGRYQLWMSPLALIDAGINPQRIDPDSVDGIKYEGLLYEVNGEPQRWRDLNGNLDHLVIFCRRVEG